MIGEHDRLVQQYRRLATRYADQIGPPPPMPVKLEHLVKTVQGMRAALIGERDPEAGAPVTGGRVEDLWHDGVEVGAVVELLDANGKRAGTRRVTLPVDDQTVQDFFADVARRAPL